MASSNVVPIDFVSEDGIGIDGPWPYIRVSVYEGHNMTLFPTCGDINLLINGSSCSNNYLTPCPSSPFRGVTLAPWTNSTLDVNRTGEWDLDFPKSILDISPSWNTVSIAGLLPLTVFGTGYVTTADLTLSMNGRNVMAQDVATLISDDLVIQYPGGNNFSLALDIGMLSLRSTYGPVSYVRADDTGGNDTVNASTTGWALRSYDGTNSSSVSLHYGSAGVVNIPPSLVFGGYDTAHILSNYSRYSAAMYYDLVDIGIGFSGGKSPIPNVSNDVSGLLSLEAPKLVSLTTILEPGAPYMYLPKFTCETISKYLPVSFNEDLGLYIWNTKTPSYEAITSSLTYLWFDFQADQSIFVTRIKVPFGLLNKTLSPPLTTRGLPYFPCRPYEYLNPYLSAPYGGGPVAVLGRSFLQQAFWAADWANNVSYIGQGPGPDMAESSLEEGIPSTFLQTSTMLWEDTWSSKLQLLSTTPTYPLSSADSTNMAGSKVHGLSDGKAAGIGISIAAFTLLMLGLCVFIYRRRSPRESTAPSGSIASYIFFRRSELAGRSVNEMESTQRYHEAGGLAVYEMDTSEAIFELPDTSGFARQQ